MKQFLTTLCAVAVLALTAGAQEARAPFAYTLGNAKSSDGTVSYSVSATAPSKSAEKGQQLKFVISRTTGRGTDWNYFMLGTGKSKSLAQVQSMLAAALAKFPAAPAGTELCKIGDIKYGGELKLVSRGANELEFAYDPPMNSGNPRLSAADAAAFAQILAQ
ncbi:MAG: hypothetical protein JSR82_00560 [Verrucomicrobia bacterium]|nr:hypothetical protein [Verrucomicrobiota bacterium]